MMKIFRQFYKWIIPVILLVFLCSGFSAADDKEKSFIYKVHYIATKKEKKAFKKLETEKEKKKFIEKFWKKRDPTPSTEVNEFKKQFLKRKKEANKLFRGEAKTGWKTDRGKIYILLGEPDERREKPFMGTKTSKEGDIGADRDYSIREWIYYNLPQEYGLGPQVKIEFVDKGWNRVRLKSRLDYNIDIVRGIGGGPADMKAIDESVSSADVGDVTQAQKGAQESAASEKLTPEQVIENLLTENESKEAFDFLNKVYFFKTREENKTRAYITVGVKPSDISEEKTELDIHVGAFLKKKGVEREQGQSESSDSKEKKGLKKIPDLIEYEGNKDFDRNTYHLYQVDVGVVPDTWIMKLAVYDKVSGKKALNIRELNVPSYEERPKLSSFVLLKDYQKIEKGGEENVGKFFTVQNLQLVPELDSTLVKGKQPLNIYYQVYNSDEGNLKKYDRHIKLRIKRPQDEKYKLLSNYPKSELEKRNNVGTFSLNKKNLNLYPSAKYELEVEVMDSEDKKKKDSEKLRYTLKEKEDQEEKTQD